VPEPDTDKASRKTPGDVADERSKSEADKADQTDDDLIAESDPLVRARKGAFDDADSKTTAKPARKDQEPTVEDGAEVKTEEDPAKDGDKPADDSEPADDAEEPKPKEVKKAPSQEDDKLLEANLPEEDWQKMTHKGKSLFLGMRKVAKAAKAEVTKATEEAKKYRGDYDAVEGFVKEQGIAGDEFRNGMITLGLVKRGDARVIPSLEKTLADIRQQNGIKEPVHTPPPPPFTRAELKELIEAAKDDFSFDGLESLVKKMEAAETAATQRQQAPPPSQEQRQSQGQPTGGADAERVVMGNIADYLVGEGIDPQRIESYVGSLLRKNPELAKAPVHKRFAEIQRVHKAERSASKTPVPSRQPVSGRGRGTGGAQSSSSTKSIDPLVLARQGKLKF
jgi:hypothetical protein